MYVCMYVCMYVWIWITRWWWFLTFFFWIFTPKNWGRCLFWRAYFLNGLKPPTRISEIILEWCWMSIEQIAKKRILMDVTSNSLCCSISTACADFVFLDVCQTSCSSFDQSWTGLLLVFAMTQQYHEHLLEAGQKPENSGDPWRWFRWFRWLLLLGLLALALRIFTENSIGASPSSKHQLYISFHGDGSAKTPLPEYGVNQIMRFNLEDLSIPGMPVLDLSGSPTPPRMLRDMLVLKDGTLFVAQGLKFDSCILQYGPCDQHGMRPGKTTKNSTNGSEQIWNKGVNGWNLSIHKGCFFFGRALFCHGNQQIWSMLMNFLRTLFRISGG